MRIGIKRLTKTAKLPKKGNNFAACYDVFIDRIEVVSESKVIIGLGFATEMTEDFKGIIVPRSSLTHKGWIIANSPSQVDSDYRGEWIIRLEAIPSGTYSSYNSHPLSYPSFPYKVGDRIAQCYFERIWPANFEELEELSTTERGTDGFGSTGLT